MTFEFKDKQPKLCSETEIINDFCCNMMRQDGYGNEQLKWYQWKFYLTNMDWQSILNWSCCLNTNGEEPLVSILCLFHELRYLNCNVYSYFSSVRLDRHIISSDFACTWSSSKALHNVMQAHSIIHLGHVTTFMGQNLHLGLS